MKSFKKFVAEVAQPKPEEEKRFKDMHSYEVRKHPVALDAQFTGEIDKAKAKRIADQEGEANYDKPLKNAEKRMVPESVNEEVYTVDIDHTGDHDANAKKHNISLAQHKHGAYAVGKKKDLQKYLVKHYDSHEDAKEIHPEVFKESSEQIDEISKDMTDRYMKKAMPQYKRAQTKQHVGGYGSTTQKGADANKERLRKRHKGIGSVHKRQGGSEVVDRNPGRNTMTSKPAPYQHESVEQIDEISKELAGRYIKKAQVSSADAGMDTASQDKNIRQRGIKTFLKRRKGVDSAVNRLMKDEELTAKQKKIDANKNGKIDGHDLAMLRAKKKNEEVELDETTSSALKRPVTQTGPDGKTRTVMKKARNDRTDDRGQDKFESVELDEAVKLKRGPMRLKDGSQIMVSKEDADLLNRMFSDLSANNQRQMQKVMMMDKAGFEEIRGFAREAL